MANDLKKRFSTLCKKWTQEFGFLTKEERELPKYKDKIKGLIKNMVRIKRAKAKIERGAVRVKTTSFWKEMRKEAGSHSWWEKLKARKPRQSFALGIKGIVDDIYENMGKGTRTMKVDAKDEARWECPPLPKDLGNIRNADPFWMTPDGPLPRKDCVCMPEREKRWNFRMVPGHATVDEVLGKKEFWKYNPRKATGPDGWPYELIAVLHNGPSSKEAMRNLLRAVWTFATLPSITRLTKITTMLKPTKTGDRAPDFRRLSLSSTVKRIAEKLCAKVMLEEYSIAEVQGGFRKRRCCSGRLLVVLGSVPTPCSTNGQNALCVLSITGASLTRCARIGSASI